MEAITDANTTDLQQSQNENNNDQIISSSMEEDIDFDNVDHIVENQQTNTDTIDSLVILKPPSEKFLSQEFNKLSTETTLKSKISIESEKIPNYLNKSNKSFRQMVYQIRSVIVTQANKNEIIEDLRQIAILIYKIITNQTNHQLWTIYLKSGTGQIMIMNQQSTKQPMSIYNSMHTTISVWPKELKTIIQSTAAATNLNKTNENEICMNFVNKKLHELNQQLAEYQMELNVKFEDFHVDDTITIQTLIETYIKHNLHLFRLNIEHQIELIQYDYYIQAIKLEYFRCNPTAYQKQLMKVQCKSKYEQEITEQEYNFLKQQMLFYNLPSQSFECSSMAHDRSSLFDSIQNVNIRQQLYEQYRNIAEQSKAKMFLLYMKTAEMQMNECKQTFDSEIQKMWTDRRSTSDTEKIPLYMIQLIEERYKKISQRIQCIYNFKYQCFLLTCQKNTI